jgi:hypothetical protein
MMQRNPDIRPTASEALAKFEELVLTIDQNLLCHPTPSSILSHWCRTMRIQEFYHHLAPQVIFSAAMLSGAFFFLVYAVYR